MDYQLLATQKWLNKTYGNVPNFNKVNENGKTGWPTIYALIKGLQYELGIPLMSGSEAAFGDKTSELFDSKITNKLTNGYKNNTVQLIQGAFWAKGISPEAFDGQYSNKTTNAIKMLQQSAGIPEDGKLNAELAKALFDMSAFSLVAGGDAKIRQIQQYLNAHYHDVTGILPTDGIYQRSTNQALIYGVQVELGLKGVANGFWGPATSANYRSAYFADLSTELMKLVQFAIYVNMKDYDEEHGISQVSFTGTLDSVTIQNLRAFQNFMQLSPKVDGEPDYITMNSLMSSAGSTKRFYFGVDTAKPLTATNIQALVDDDVHYIGRYLTGTIGVGANRTAKNLTRSEAESIINANLHLVPIYQDNTGDVSDYTYASGVHDAQSAMNAALELGIPDGHTIYFAVDTDMTEDENVANAIPYFQAIAKFLKHYQIGIYGTRNTCTMVSKKVSGVKYAYVSNMSTGFSGNLGFSQPLNWAFDQFDEVGPEGNLPGRDKVAVSHQDEGVTTLVDSRQATNWIEDSNWSIIKQLIASHKLELNGKSYVLVNDPSLKISVAYKNVTTVNPDQQLTFTYPIKNGKIDSSLSAELKNNGFSLGSDLSRSLNKFTAGLESGFMTIQLEMGKASLYANKISIEISDKDLRNQTDDIEYEDVIVFDVELNWDNLEKQLTMILAKPANDALKQAAQTMLPLLQRGFNLSGQLLVALSGSVSAVLDSVGELPTETKAQASVYTIIGLILLFIFGGELA